MTDEEALFEELASMHKGAGVWRPDLDDVLGRNITAALRLDIRSPNLRDELIGQLRHIAAELPGESGQIFLAAAGITDRAKFLQDRVARIAQGIQRDQRTARRRIASAESLVASRLAARLEASDVNAIANQAWSVERLESETRLDLERPEVTAVREILVTRPLAELVESFSLVMTPDTEEGDLEILPVDDTAPTELTRLSDSSWQYRVKLPAPLRPGDTFRYAIRLRFPSVSWLNPYVVMIPFRRCQRFVVRVCLPATVTRVWRLNGVSPVAINDQLPASPIAPSQYIDAVFLDLIPGLAYGVRWE